MLFITCTWPQTYSILEEDIKSKNPVLRLGAPISRLFCTKDNSSSRMYAALNGKITHVHALLFHIYQVIETCNGSEQLIEKVAWEEIWVYAFIGSIKPLYFMHIATTSATVVRLCDRFIFICREFILDFNTISFYVIQVLSDLFCTKCLMYVLNFKFVWNENVKKTAMK